MRPDSWGEAGSQAVPSPSPHCLCVLLSHSEYYHFRQAWVLLRLMPPEAILEGDFSTKSDVWAFGVLMWGGVHPRGDAPMVGRLDDEVLAGRQFSCSLGGELTWGPGAGSALPPLRAGVRRYMDMAAPLVRFPTHSYRFGK